MSPEPAPIELRNDAGLPTGWRAWVAVLAPFASAGTAWAAHQLSPTLQPGAAVMLGIIVLVSIYWATEAVSIVAGALLAIALCAVVLGLPASRGAAWPGPGVEGWEQLIAPAGSGIMVLLFGSLVLGDAFQRTGLAARLGAAILGSSMASSARLIGVVLLVTAFLSMWLSNTATGAIMVAVARPLWSNSGVPSPLRAGVVLAIAVGANLGGIASPVGTPPNAIVFTLLRERHAGFSFLDWMMIGVPLSVALLAGGWAIIMLLTGAARHTARVVLTNDHSPCPAWARRTVGAVFALTALLWITESWTGVPIALGAMLPIVALTLAGVTGPRHLATLEWDVLLMILGGLVLGSGMAATGLADWLIAVTNLGSLPPMPLVILLTILAAVLSAFMSNTAVANLIAPLGLGLAAAAGAAAGGDEGASRLPIEVGMGIALGANASMPFPVSTPANAMAHRTGALPSHQLMMTGMLLAALSVGLVAAGAWLRLPG